MFVQATDAPVEAVDAGITRQVLAHDPELMMVRVAFRRGAVGSRHSYPHRQVTYVESGRFEANIGNETRLLVAGDCFLAPPDVPHGVTALEDGALIDVFTPARRDFVRS
jgi:quercetin dioxygenase-like cupin family protein